MIVSPSNGYVRTATITLYSMNGSEPVVATIVVNQKGKDTIPMEVTGTTTVTATDVTSHSFVVSTEDTSMMFDDYVGPTASWLHIDSADKRVNTYTINYHCDENTTKYSRTDSIRVKKGPSFVDVTIKQEGASDIGTLTLPIDKTTISANQQQITFIVEATGSVINKPFSITSSA